MAERKKTANKPAARPAAKKRPAPKKKTRALRKKKGLLFPSRRHTSASEFRQDPTGTSLAKSLHMTVLQRLHLLRWFLYGLECVLALVVQDVIMSRIHLFGATTDLATAVILMITVLEGSEVGGVFALIATTVYHFSGSSPGAYTVGLITCIGVLAALARRSFWRRSPGSILLCSGAAVMVYEIALFLTAVFLQLTRWGRLPMFIFTGIYSIIFLIPLYFLTYRIGLIGGNQWNE